MKENKNKTILGMIIVFLAMGVSACSNETNTTSNSHSENKVEVKKVGTKRLKKAEDKQKTLSEEKKDKEEEYQKLKYQLDTQKEEEAKKEEQQKLAAEQKEKQEKAAAEAKKEQEATAQQSSTNTSASSDNGNHGDMNTAETGQIVGNAKSHIYHVPGQAGYRMNSSNAVYFNSEQDAINAGYRKALR